MHVLAHMHIHIHKEYTYNIYLLCFFKWFGYKGIERVQSWDYSLSWAVREKEKKRLMGRGFSGDAVWWDWIKFLEEGFRKWLKAQFSQGWRYFLGGWGVMVLEVGPDKCKLQKQLLSGKEPVQLYTVWTDNKHLGLFSQQIVVEASNVDRCLMSAYCNLAGLYPPSGTQVWNQNITWQPIPVHTRPEWEDNVSPSVK